MTIIGWIRIALITWQAISKVTKGTADEKIASELSAALDEYERVQGTEVTKIQLEGLRVSKLW